MAFRVSWSWPFPLAHHCCNPPQKSLAETLVVSIAVLRNDRFNSLWSFKGETQEGRRAIVKDIDCKAGDLQRVEPLTNSRGNVCERVRVVVWDGCETESGKVGSVHVVRVGQPWNQVTVLGRRAWKAVEEDESWLRGGSGFHVVDGDAVGDFDVFVGRRRGHLCYSRMVRRTENV